VNIATEVEVGEVESEDGRWEGGELVVAERERGERSEVREEVRGK
jgi:hypothetical protein